MADKTLLNIENNFGSIITEKDNDHLEPFLTGLFQNKVHKYAIFSFTLEAIDPLAYLEMCWNKSNFQYYWEKPTEEFAIAGGKKLVSISATGPNRFRKINTQFEAIRQSTAEYSVLSYPYSGMMLLGGFSFFDHIEGELWNAYKPASFTVPKWMIIKDGKFTLATIGVKLESFDSPAELREHLRQQIGNIKRTINLNIDKNQSKPADSSYNTALPKNGSGYNKWISSVRKAKKLIDKKSFEKLVLARQISVSKSENIAPTQVLNKLRQQYANCYNFLIHHPEGETFLGSTPERLGTFRNKLLLTDALAGSIQRGNTATEDTVFEKYLSDSRKDLNEHNFVIKDIEERLKPYVNSLNRNPQPEIKKLSNVQHLYTPIRAKLKDDVNILTVIGQLHPTPAVGGYPWKDAAEYINELETFDRGWYAGPIGWFNARGDGEFAVAIRSGLFTETEAHFFAGCGIVSNSNPESEWEETNLKLKPMLSALQYD
jgi:menaquinone-specific isochorismate synthase